MDYLYGFGGYFGLVWLVFLGLIIGLPIYFLTRKKDATKPTTSTSHLFLGFALFVMTIILAQQIINVIFPDENSTRIIAKMVIDTALIAIGLGIHHRVVGAAILYAGVVRFILIFFQLQGMDPVLRIVVIIITIIILFVVGFIKFGKNLASGQRS